MKKNTDVTDVTDVVETTTPSAAETTAEVEEATTDQVDALTEEMGLDQFESEQLLNIGIDCLNRAMSNIVKAGLCFLRIERIPQAKSLKLPCADVRTSVNDGLYKTLKDRGIDARRAYEAMSIAKFVSSLSPYKRKSIMSLGKSKALLLSSLPAESIADIIDHPESIDQFDTMPVKELKEWVRNLKYANKEQEEKIEKQEEEINLNHVGFTDPLYEKAVDEIGAFSVIVEQLFYHFGKRIERYKTAPAYQKMKPEKKAILMADAMAAYHGAELHFNRLSKVMRTYIDDPDKPPVRMTDEQVARSAKIVDEFLGAAGVTRQKIWKMR